MELSLPVGGGTSLAFTVEDLARMSPAFAGTVTEVTDDHATVQVDRWYVGGSTPEVS